MINQVVKILMSQNDLKMGQLAALIFGITLATGALTKTPPPCPATPHMQPLCNLQRVPPKSTHSMIQTLRRMNSETARQFSKG